MTSTHVDTMCLLFFSFVLLFLGVFVCVSEMATLSHGEIINKVTYSFYSASRFTQFDR